MHQEFEEEERTDPADEFAAALLPTGGVMGAYVLVAEVVTDDRTTLQVSTSGGTAPWTIMGMIDAAAHIVAESTSLAEREEREEE